MSTKRNATKKRPGHLKLQAKPHTMQRKSNDTKGPNKDHARSRGLPGPTDEDYKRLYDDLMTLRRSLELLDPEDPAQWNQDRTPQITEDPETVHAKQEVQDGGPRELGRPGK